MDETTENKDVGTEEMGWSHQELGRQVSNKYDRGAAFKDESWVNAEVVDKGENEESFVDALVVSILTITAIANSAYAIIAPFLPFEFERKNIDQSWIGYIFSIYSVAVIFCSPLVGKMMSIFGRRNLVTFGMFLMGTSFISFGVISELETKETFITLSLFTRFFQGFSSSLIQTTMYSISANFYPDNKDAMIGYIEAVTGIGLIMGPIIGSGLYAIGGYKFIFYSFGSLFIIGSQFVKLFLDEKVDRQGPVMTQNNDALNKTAQGQHSASSAHHLSYDPEFDRYQRLNSGVNQTNGSRLQNNEDERYQRMVSQSLEQSPEMDMYDQEVVEENQETGGGRTNVNENVSVLGLLMHPRFFFACMSGSLGYFLYGFMEPILAFRIKDYNLSQVEIGMFFTILPMFYIPASVLVQKVPNGVQKRAIIIIACILSFFGNLFVGPSKLFSFPDTVWMAVVGQIAHGIVDPFILVPSLPEMIESVIPHYPGQEEKINDLSSGLFNMFLGIGQVIGPLYGAIVTETYGYKVCADVVAIISLFFAVLYYLITDGKEALVTSKWVDVPRDNQQMILQAAPMPGICTPCSNPSTMKAMMKNLSNKYKVINDENNQLQVLYLKQKMGSEVFVPRAANKGSFGLRGLQAGGRIDEIDADNDFFMMEDEQGDENEGNHEYGTAANDDATSARFAMSERSRQSDVRRLQLAKRIRPDDLERRLRKHQVNLNEQQQEEHRPDQLVEKDSADSG